MSEKFICIHGHFYQPPRENPWLEEVEFEESAHPYHDWNARITAECYAPNSVSRIMDLEGRIIGLANNYEKISFNFGPTLLYWLERHQPQLYQSILDADKVSIKRFSGHGSAIAQIYNHMIMPLANRRDKETQVKWGIRDFETRFGRFPEGMWLSETAVDIETLEVLAENGIKFTILSPHQASHIRKLGDQNWIDISGGKINPQRAYLCRLPSGKTINLFFFNKGIASDASFGDMLNNGEYCAIKLVSASKDNEGDELVSLATDGELYGHHRTHGDMALAYCLYIIETRKLARITNFAEYLANHPPQFEVQIVENTSWSCTHGIERWRSDCGDNTGKYPSWRQTWRKPLREAMDWLRDILALNFEIDAQEYLKTPWVARNEYINVILDRSKENVEKFLSEQSKEPLEEKQKQRVMKLLEMQRHAMLMYTSCGWFFDEVSGMESVQVMMYAARAMQLARDLFGLELEAEYLQRLRQAPSNIPEFGDGTTAYQVLVKPSMTDFHELSAQNIMLSLFASLKPPTFPPQLPGCCFKIGHEASERLDNGKFRVTVNRLKVYSNITLDEANFGGAAVWLGDHNVSCGVMQNMPDALFSSMRREMLESFEKGQINEAILLIPKFFGKNTYSLKDLFRDDQRRILDFIVAGAQKKAKDLYEIIYHDNSALLHFMNEIRLPSPKPFRVAAEVVLNIDMAQALSSEEPDIEKLKRQIEEAGHFQVTIDSELLALKASEKIANALSKLSETPEDIKLMEKTSRLIRTINELPLKLNLWRAQNIAYKMAENLYGTIKSRRDEQSQAWVAVFRELCELMGIRLD